MTIIFNFLDLESNFEFTTPAVSVYDVDGFREVRILCIPPKSYPNVAVDWRSGSSSSSLTVDGNEIKRNDSYLLNGKSYYSLEIKNAVAYGGNKIECVARNPVIQSTEHNAVTNVVLYGKF